MKKSLVKVLIAIAAILPAYVWSSEFHVELGAGSTQYTARADGIWYQLGMSHHLELNGRAYKFGVTGDAYASDDWGVTWHADYVNLGHIRSDCACTTIDAYYDMKAHVLAHNGYVPVAEYSGHGGAQGILLSLAPYVQRGNWRIGVEAGLFPYRPDWHETVYGWHIEPGPTVTSRGATPYTWQWGKMFGAFVKHDRFTVSYELYRLPTRFDDKHLPAQWTGAHMLMVSYEF